MLSGKNIYTNFVKTIHEPILACHLKKTIDSSFIYFAQRSRFRVFSQGSNKLPHLKYSFKRHNEIYIF